MNKNVLQGDQLPERGKSRLSISKWRTFSGSLKQLIAVLGRFRMNRRGSSAVEFALVVGPFLVILFGILELALIFIVSTSLNAATAALAKQIRTGEIQAPGLFSTTSSGSQLDLKDAVNLLCNQIQIVSLATCIQQLQIDVRPINSFQQTATTSPVNGGTFNSSSLCYYSGNAGDIVEMRAYYLYMFFNPVLLATLSNISSYVNGGAPATGRYFLIQTAQVFKSESYSGNSNTGVGC